MHSCIYTGWVNHVRHHPRRHQFRYRVFQMFLDLDELPTLFQKQWFWSTGKPNLAWFRRKDHFGDSSISLKDSVNDFLEQETGSPSNGPIRLLTHLCYWGCAINPVSFYYCYSSDGQQVKNIIAEVHNTPWGEEHCYLLTPDWTNNSPDTPGKFQHPKEFHVSPFMEMNYTYAWELTSPGNSLAVQIQNLSGTDCHFEASLSLKRKPLTSWNLARTLCRHPFMTGKVAAAIYWQAVKLWWKKIPIVPHPSHTPEKIV